MPRVSVKTGIQGAMMYSQMTRSDRAGLLEIVGGTDELDRMFPLFDNVVSETGRISASVFGVIARSCLQNDSGICSKNKHVIGKEAGLSRKTAINSVFKLCQAEYLIELNSEVMNRPLAYVLSTKVLEVR